MNVFSITIPWDEDGNKEQEKRWVAQVNELMYGGSGMHALTEFYSPVLERLRRDSADFTVLGFRAEPTEEGVTIVSTEEAAGDKDNAALYIKAFLDTHRKNTAVRFPWVATEENGRVRRGVILIGPDGINVMKLPAVRKARR